MFYNVFPKIVPFYVVLSKKYDGAREAADDNMATRCMLD
jgi:hypothetical protein